MKGANESRGARSRSAGNGGSSAGRKDVWTEEATAVLIEAWGDRFLRLSRGNLRQADWLDVAGAVNARLPAGAGRPKTDYHCKNRIDTVKKRYKLEKTRPGRSSWAFFPLLRDLLSPPADKSPESSAAGASSSSSPSSGNSFERRRPVAPVPAIGRKIRERRIRRVDGTDERGMAMRGLAKAVARFGEIYERVEGAKQEQMVELERQRMAFAKELEFQKMQMLMEAQLELEKMKRPKNSSVAASGKNS